MATLRDLKRRIRSVQNTQQITKAMEMVAAAKLRKAQDKMGAARPYAEKLNEVLRLLAASGASAEHPFFRRAEKGREAILVVTSDRGLCGSFNAQVCRTVELETAGKDKKNFPLIIVGKRGTQYFRTRKWDILESFVDFGDQVSFAMVQEVTRAAIDAFGRDDVASVRILSTQFISATRRNIHPIEFLPVVPPAEENQAVPRDYIFEPSEAEIFEEILPRFTTAVLYSVLAESFTAEHSARMVAMGNATRNAGELIDKLVLQRNRLRQAAITSELADIVGAVEALS